MAIDLTNLTSYQVPTDPAVAREHISLLRGNRDFTDKLLANDSISREIWSQLNRVAASGGGNRNGVRPETDTDIEASVAKQDRIRELMADKEFVQKLHSGDAEATAEWQDLHREAYSGITRMEITHLETDDTR